MINCQLYQFFIEGQKVCLRGVHSHHSNSQLALVAGKSADWKSFSKNQKTEVLHEKVLNWLMWC